ncbi:MAG: CapA family protein [Mesorhizobium sp.]|nr:MAG: CapA family protein [Mesorhizobium sp.]
MSTENAGHPVDGTPGYDVVGSISTNVADGFTMVAVGDLIVSRAVTKSQDSGFGDVVKILRNADTTFGNLEVNAFDIRSFNGYPQAEYGGAYHLSLPEVGQDLKAMGFNILGRANNHSFDWGVEGMRETSRVLDQNGIIHAGVGENLAQAGAARFFETARGRVALLSCASTFKPMARAGDPAGEAPGRPGLNALRLAQSIVVSPEMLENVRLISSALPSDIPFREDPVKVVLAGTTYKAGDKIGYSFEPDARDVADILRNVRRGKQFSDFCIVANHCHEPGNWSDEPPDYERSFAHRLIDAGADAYVGHGPHQLRGIEIFKGRPIFYSLGNFFQDDLGTPTGAEMFGDYAKDPRVHTDAEVKVAEMASYSDPVFWESIVARSQFKQNQLAELRLYPIELGRLRRFADRGVPRLVNQEEAKTILERLQKLSEPFGTEIAIENDVGVIRLKPGASP